MPLLSDWLTVLVVGFVVVVTPGANFAMTMRNSLVHSRQAGLYTALGVGLGSIIHVTYCLLGIGVIISQSILLFNALKWLGAAYLIYIGIKSLRTKKLNTTENLQIQRNIGNWSAIRVGSLTSLLNPKATLLFLAVFTQLIQPNSPLTAQIIYGLTVIALEIIWYSLVALFISQRNVKRLLTSFMHWVERVMGLVLILLGLRLALAKETE
jgi:RhtB (resistance to homoserine/threonine) family protein